MALSLSDKSDKNETAKIAKIARIAKIEKQRQDLYHDSGFPISAISENQW